MTQTAHKTESTILNPGDAFKGGFFAGNFMLKGQCYALIVAPKETGEYSDINWNNGYSFIEGATSYNDGLANTLAMAEAGSELAKWMRSLDINDKTDWYLPSQDEREILYRHLKPTTNKNYLYNRSGINVSAVPPTYPYSKDLPAQTQAEHFKQGGEQAFENAWYWSSTQHADNAYYAWCQHFGNGRQDYNHEDLKLHARAVRRVAVAI